MEEESHRDRPFYELARGLSIIFHAREIRDGDERFLDVDR